MSDVDDPGGGSDRVNGSVSALPATSLWAEGGKSTNAAIKMRSFEEIIADAKANRNILEIHLKKNLHNETTKPANLTYDQLGELLFDILKIDSNQCIRFNFSTSRYDTREVVFKPGVDLLPYTKVLSDFYGHTVTTKKQSSNVVRVSFRNVPSIVPDEEIIHLCSYYGKPLNNQVDYDKMTNSKCAGLPGSNRYVDIELSPGKALMNYYWMEGPLPGDQGCRITVLHSGQDRQCSHCLKTFSSGCPGQGQGKVCKELGTKMTRMSDYVSQLKLSIGYESLKTAYLKKFPALGQDRVILVEDAEKTEDDEEDKEVSNKEINDLKKDLKESLAAVHSSDQKLHHSKRANELAKNKISTATAGLNMYLRDNISKEYFDEFNPVFKFLVSQFSTLLYQPDCYSVNCETHEVKLAEDLFIEIEKSDPSVKENLSHFKDQLANKIAMDLSIRKERRTSISILNRPRTLSNSCKRKEQEQPESVSKIARPTRPSSTSLS